ncbi:MAG: hypothetical protein A4E38_00819 [Methanoregulaceae archaeon PtaB.Bin108]|nr:MAG: hypothetical protein A4E38_00819 [Methanoregulaceae archaeon PtaB.Bin108]
MTINANPSPYPPRSASEAANTSGPATAPTWSSASWIPKPQPLPTCCAAWERIVSFEGDRIAFPNLSRRRSMTATCQDPAKTRRGIAPISRYPAIVKAQ